MVSIIVPCFNEEKAIGACLRSILAQTYTRSKLQIIVVDGNSNDKTREVIHDMAKDGDIVLLDNPRRTPPYALNIGLKAATGDLIMRVDGHTILAPDYVDICVSTLLSGDYDCVGGAIRNRFSSSMGMINAAILGSRFGVGNSEFRIAKKRMLVDTAAFGVYRRAVFDKIGIFNENLSRNQDIEFNQRLIKAGGQILLEPRAVAYYQVRETLKGLMQQGYVNGKWNVISIRIAGNHLKLRHFIPMIFVTMLSLSTVISLFTWIPLAVISITYGLFLLVATFDMAKNVEPKCIVLLPFATALLHLSYGCGSWAAVFDTGNNKKKVIVGDRREAACSD
jgi:glycosyltransferase involved in cell wall biosynthesis